MGGNTALVQLMLFAVMSLNCPLVQSTIIQNCLNSRFLSFALSEIPFRESFGTKRRYTRHKPRIDFSFGIVRGGAKLCIVSVV